MNIPIFNRNYTVRRYESDGTTYTDFTVSMHLHESEQDSGQIWNETQGIVRRLDGHGNTELRVADLEAGTKGDRVYYRGLWYECTAATLYDHTMLGHWNYRFIAVPEDAVEVITLFNVSYSGDDGYGTFKATVIKGVSWISEDTATIDNVGLRGQHMYTIRIPEDADFSGSTYVSPKAYTGETGTFTLHPGDLIVRGEETEITVQSELKEKYDELVTVTSVGDHRNAPNHRHWKVVGQ